MDSRWQREGLAVPAHTAHGVAERATVGSCPGVEGPAAHISILQHRVVVEATGETAIDGKAWKEAGAWKGGRGE